MIVTIGVLWHLGILSSTIEYLDSENLAFKVGKARLTPFDFIKAIFMLVVLLWISGRISSLTDSTLRKTRHIGSSNRTLIVKTLTILLYFVSFLLSLGAVGVSLTSLTVFGGALGIGLGFGLQKIASNFISGIILLFEKSINEGDLIELGNGVKGIIRKTGARYMLMDAGDGREIFIPNEDLITSRVTNWTFSTLMSRIEVKLRISLDSNPRQAQQIIIDVIKTHPKCSKLKAPDCFISSMEQGYFDYAAHMWIDNFADSGAITHDLLLQIWEALQKDGIKIYHPARDIYMQAETTSSQVG